MPIKPTLLAFDMEGVFTPEIWIAVAEKTGIEKLKLTTRDVPDYDQLMRGRLKLLDENRLTIRDIQAAIRTLSPLPGAKKFLDWARAKAPVIVLSDTYYEFAAPLIEKLGQPVLFCNSLEIGPDGQIQNYHLRIKDGKMRATESFQSLGFRVIACGDSYNDTKMLLKADEGILFRPPPKVIAEFPQFPVFTEFEALKAHLEKTLGASR